MHRTEEGRYFAYAQWPDKHTYENVSTTQEGARLSYHIKQYLEKDEGIKILQRLQVVEDDLLQN